MTNRPLGRRRGRWSMRRIRRHPAAFWAASAVIALTAGASVIAATSGAERTLARYGSTELVAVAARDLEPGSVVGAGDIAWEERPGSLVAGDPSPDPVGRVVTDPILADEPLVDARLAPDGLSPVAAAVPAGSRAVAVPTALGLPPLEVGDRVDLVSAPGWAGPGETGLGIPTSGASSIVARGAEVVAVDDELVTVAIDRDDLRAAAGALAMGGVVVALAGAPG